MARYAMTVDTKKCVACGACVLACKHENNVADKHARDWTVTIVKGKYPNLRLETYSERCHHCTEAPCVYSCPTGASHFADGGIVKVDPGKCTGCKACINSCPYDARYITPEGYVDKCTFCHHRVLDDKNPACVEVCPTHCLTFGDLEDPKSEVSLQLQLRNSKQLKPAAGTKPNLYLLTRGLE